MKPKAIEQWLAIASANDYDAIGDLLAVDAEFLSPVVHTAQKGHAITFKYLKSAMRLLGNDRFRYTEMWFADRSAVLEFETELDGLYVNGVDIIRWDEGDKINYFKVMVRPLKAIGVLREQMAAALQAAG